MRIPKVISAVFLSVLLLTLWGCDEDKPTQPIEPKDYYVYFASETDVNKYFRYHTGTGEIESFPAPYSTTESGYGISPDGKTMYMRANGSNSIVEISLDSLAVVGEYPIIIREYSPVGRHQKVIVSPNGRFLAILNNYLHIYEMSDFSFVYRDTINEIGNGIFCHNGDDFFCIVRDSTSNIYAQKIDFSNGFAKTNWLLPGDAPHIVIPDRNYEKLFLYMHVYNDLYLFQVYDTVSDSTIFSKSLCPGSGDMEITPDDRYIIFCQPGTILIGCPPPRYFTIFDVEGNQIEREVDAFVDSLGIVYATSELYLTPDGRHLIGIGYMSNGLFDYDMQRHVFNRHVVTDGIRFMFSLGGQSRP